MDEVDGTDSIRALAPKWSLAGDDRLLSLLEKTHQRIISKCQDVNSKLEEMASALDDASINLQNVNNKFMALSNSQFIESRVYDDDDDITTDTQPVKELAPPPPLDELTILKNSLAILEQTHETAEILDDSDSDSDTEISVVLKPKDMYSHRPLPHIIGSQQWRNKWHAGLIVEDSSDSDSGSSKRDSGTQQYSDSESDAPRANDRLGEPMMSESSSSLCDPPGASRPPGASPPRRPPADIAAELARRLGAAQVVPQEPEEYAPPVPTTRKVYKPEKPAPSHIFPDEPPPLDVYEQNSPSEDEDDIFAEINKKAPYSQQKPAQNDFSSDLFSFEKAPHGAEEGDIFSDFAAGNVNPQQTQKSMLFEDEPEPELFTESSPKEEIVQNNNNIQKQEEASTKKPIGGISPFGTNQGAESIGAAILKRNQRKSSTSGDESGSDNIKKTIIEKPKTMPRRIDKTEVIPKIKNVDETDNESMPKKEKDIFDDLFAKSKKVTEKKPIQKIVKEVAVKEKEKKNVKDLFSDNLFDDIDDIFTSNVKIPPKETNQKSIFDDDDDDLFSEIAKPEVIVNQTSIIKDNNKTSNKESKSIFDSDEDLFSNVKKEENIKTSKMIESQKSEPSKLDKNDKVNSNDFQEKQNYNDSGSNIGVESLVKPTETTKERNLFDDSPQKTLEPEIKTQTKSKGIFDSDSDEDIFSKLKMSDSKKSKNPENVFRKDLFKSENNIKPPIEHLKSKDKSVMESPSLFGEDEIDELFTNSNNPKPVEPIDFNIEHNLNISLEAEDNKEIFIGSKDFKEDGKLDNVIAAKYEKIETQQNIIEELKNTNEADIFEEILPDDDMFPSPNVKSVNIPSQNIVEKEMEPEVIESSQNISKPAKESKIESIVDQNKTDIHSKDSIISEARNTDTVIETTTLKPQTDQSIFDDLNEPVKVKDKEPVTAFDDIFSEPPAFKKPSEPKKSKNVNALFDDDSDDESLFFKKNDVISDEKPDVFPSNANFGLFVDEPPAIDVDFTTKSSKNVDLSDDDGLFESQTKIIENETIPIKNTDPDDDDDDGYIFSSLPTVPQTKLHSTPADAEHKQANKNKEEKSQNKDLFSNDIVEDLFTTPQLENPTNTETTLKEKPEMLSKDIGESNEDLFNNLSIPSQKDISKQAKLMQPKETKQVETTNKFDDILISKESPKKETKKIGKLNTKNFNINVNALMPGASPKKKPKEHKDEQNLSNQESDEPITVKMFPNIDEIDKSQPKSLNYEAQVSSKEEKEPKSLTFEEKPESEVLDNKVSKQRPKIQVKRKPSSRRARHEAVRKSGIDFGDETDNSSSIDEPVKINQSKETNNESVQSTPLSINTTKEDIQPENTKSDKEEQTQDANQDKCNTTEIDMASQSELKTSKIDNVNTNVSPSDISNIEDPKEFSSKTEITKQDTPKNVVKTKVVYILNDEDIFNTGPKHVQQNPHEDIFRTKSEVSTPDDDIFKNIEGVKTLGNTYKEYMKESTTAIKNDVNQIAGNTEMTKKDDNTILKDTKSTFNTKSSVFDDSDEELFNNNKKVTKSNIFDSDSEEDLFSGKKRKEKKNLNQKDKQVTKREEVSVKGSLFGDEDDDDDLFGVKKEKSEPRQQTSRPSTSRESATTASKSSEPVFDDPLSMLDDD